MINEAILLTHCETPRRPRRPREDDPIVGLSDDQIEGYAAQYKAFSEHYPIAHVTFGDFLRVAQTLRARAES